MTKEEALEIVNEFPGYIGWSYGSPSVYLDGLFGKKEIEAILFLMKEDVNEESKG